MGRKVKSKLKKLQGSNQNGYIPTQSFPKTSRLGFSEKKLWDWISVLLIPLMIGVGSIWVSYQQMRISEMQYLNDQHIVTENRNKEITFIIEQQRAHILKTYMDEIADLYLHKGLRGSKEGDPVREIAKMKTLLALEQLDGKRKRKLIQFIDRLGLAYEIIPPFV